LRQKEGFHLKGVVNATGTILHTNLGRAVLSQEALNAIIGVASGYSNLEFNLEKGERGSRYSHVESLLCRITGAEAAMVVNNNAAAVMLVLSTLAKDKEAIVSRGQLVEIGGSFRVPDVMEESGAHLHEVGTTNRTHLYDYENAINENTGVILRVHQSNYRIMGFTEEPDIVDLVELGRQNDIPVIEDIGSGVFVDLSRFGLSPEPTVQASIEKGMDVVTFSGDKMLGGPQAGIIVGKKQFIDAMKKNQLTRALRIDKLTLSALEATLKLYLDEERALKEIPGLRMLTIKPEELKKDATRLLRALRRRLGDRAQLEVEKSFSQVGGGSMPTEQLETYVVTLTSPMYTLDTIEERLRHGDVPVVARINKDKLILDVRTLLPKDYKQVEDALDKALQG
jgi:L-seryl-tRNA(Ser) seleniumtransferase